MAAAVAGDYPAFLDASLERVYGEGRAAEMALYGARAPIDLRVNTLKADRRRILADFERFAAAPGRYAPTAIRVPVPGGPQRAPAIEAEAAYRTGKVELQDEGSQIASLLVDPPPGAQVADLCAGAGGKTLALAAALDNAGQIHAYDADRHRLKAIHERLQRASARNVQVLRAGDEAALDALGGRMDRVVLDVPCTGSGAWRRKPDSKWRLRPQALVQRNGEQDALLRRGAGLVRRGGRLVYVTCSVLAEENEDRIAAFLGAPEGRDFAVFDLKPLWRRLFASQAPEAPTGVATGRVCASRPAPPAPTGSTSARWSAGHERLVRRARSPDRARRRGRSRSRSRNRRKDPARCPPPRRPRSPSIRRSGFRAARRRRRRRRPNTS